MHHHHVTGLTGDGTACVIMRPLRALHRTMSDAGLIGGRLVKNVTRRSRPQACSLMPAHGQAGDVFDKLMLIPRRGGMPALLRGGPMQTIEASVRYRPSPA
jgi:hypothetical protein